MNKVDSPAAGLQYKVLLLPPNPVANKDGDLSIPNSSMAVLEVPLLVLLVLLSHLSSNV